MSDILQTSVKNKLLSSLSGEDFLKLQPHLEVVPLNVHDVLVEADEPIVFVHFIEGGVGSLVMMDEGEHSLEIAVIGREGMSGIACVYGLDRSSHRTFVQVAGSALRLPADVLQTAMDHSPTLRASLMLFAHSVFRQVSFSVLAHGRYKMVQRLARWLLLCHDRLDNDDIPLTHNFLALMVGSHRPGVTIALHELEGAGGIKVSRQLIRVRDRAKLEEIAGGCYGPPERSNAAGGRQRGGDLRPEPMTA